MAMATTSNVEKMSKTAEQMTKSTQRTGQILNGYLTEVQEINTEFARKATETWIEAFRKQTELNQRMVQRLYGEAEGQTDAVRGLVQDWMTVYPAPVFNPFGFNPLGFLREGMETATRNAERVIDTAQSATTAAARMNGGFPIGGYDDMTVSEVTERLDALTADELKMVREYEKSNKNRETVIERVDRKIRAINA
ncbi:MAG TPA: hypothetical protein VK869_06425 [Rubrobacteraceae bacterium]|nr:hypothetical protein [Rubrobacteraceae bacterium]